VGLPKKIISDRDPCFTLAFFRELCKQLEVTQNLSTAYHLQTDGQSKKTNQHVKMALRIYCNYQQNDWVKWLPIVQYAINARPSAMTKQAHTNSEWDSYPEHIRLIMPATFLR